MIWIEDDVAVRDGEAIQVYLRKELESAADCVVHCELLEEVAIGLAVAWTNEFRGMPLPSVTLSLLASRILWRIGEEDAAQAMLLSVAERKGVALSLLEVVKSGGLSIPACFCLGAGIVRPSASALDRMRPVWILNLPRLIVAAGPLVEFGLLKRIRVALEQVAEVWDESSGCGVLGIPRIPGEALSHLVYVGREEVPGWCRAMLNRIQVERGWKTCPEVRYTGLIWT